MSKWGEFHGRHCQRMYTPVFNGFLEALIANERAPLFTRVCAWVLRRSWGNHSDCCVDGSGAMLGQADCARELGADRRRVNPVFQELAAVKCVRFDGWEIHPIDDPAEAEFDESVHSPRTLSEDEAKVPAFLTFIEQVIAQEAPDEYREYQILEQRRKEIRTAFLRRWDAFKKVSAGLQTLSEARPQATGQIVLGHEDTASPGGETNEPPILISETENLKQLASFAEKPPAAQTPETLVSDAVDASGLELPGNRSKAVQHSAARLAAVRPDRREAVLAHFTADCRQIAARRENRAKSWGIIVTAMEDAIRHAPSKRPQQQAPNKEIPLAEQIAAAEQWLEALPDHPQAPEVRRNLEQLRAQLPKTQKAGGA